MKVLSLLPTTAAPASPSRPFPGAGTTRTSSQSQSAQHWNCHTHPSLPWLLPARPSFCRLSAAVICSNCLHDVLEALLPSQGIVRARTGLPLLGHQHTSVLSCARTRDSLGTCLASTHLSSSSSSRFTAPTTGGPRYTSAVYSCTSEAPARIFSRASCPLLTPPTPIMGTWPVGRAQGQAGRGNASMRPQAL